MESKRHYLFTQKAHNFRLDFPHSTIERCIELWNKNYSKNYICQKLLIKPVEFALIVIDLEYAGRINPRSNGLLGTYDSEEEYNEAGNYNITLDQLDLTVRAYNSLKRAGITNLHQIKQMTDDDIRALKGRGKKLFVEIKALTIKCSCGNDSFHQYFHHESRACRRLRCQKCQNAYEVTADQVKLLYNFNDVGPDEQQIAAFKNVL